MANIKKDRDLDKRMPDPTAREPAEGDLGFPEQPTHLCCPDEGLSSDQPVEGGAAVETEGNVRR